MSVIALVKEIKKDGTGGEALTSLADKLLDVIAKIPPLDQLQPTQAAVGSKPKAIISISYGLQ